MNVLIAIAVFVISAILGFTVATITCEGNVMTLKRIISRMWSVISDFQIRERETEEQLKKRGIKITHKKSYNKIQEDLDRIEIACRSYADTDDEEVYTK